MKKEIHSKLDKLDQEVLLLSTKINDVIDCALQRVEDGDEDGTMNTLIGLKTYVTFTENKIYDVVKELWEEHRKNAE